MTSCEKKYYNFLSTDERTETRKEHALFWARKQISGRLRDPSSQLVFISSQKERGSQTHSLQYVHQQSRGLFQKAGPKYCSEGTQLMMNTAVTCKNIISMRLKEFPS